MENKVRITATMEETLKLSFLVEREFTLVSEAYNNVYDNLQLPITTICWTYHAYYPFD